MIPGLSISRPGAVLALLLAVNLLNYLDRQVLYSLLPLIQTDLFLTDAQAGKLASAFMIVYMFAAPPIGYWADRGSRRLWIAMGIALWSLATAASGLAPGYRSLFAARAAVGIGESCYGAISPSFIAEHFPASKRGSVLAVFSMAIPVGSALGYIAGGSLGEHWGWRNAFFLVSLPGLALALLSLALSEPRSRALSEPQPGPGAYLDLFSVPSFLIVTLAGAAMTFALGGFAVWMPSFFHREWGWGVGRAGMVFGAITVASGIAGSLAGGWLADWALKFTRKAYFLVSGLGLFIGLPLAVAAVLCPAPSVSLGLLFGAEFFLFLNMGPLNAIIVSVTKPSCRSMAFAANIFVIHALGDAISPAIIGELSDHFGLKIALLMASSTLGAAAGLCFWGTRHYERDASYA
ncbi:MAG: MFS transporter [Elusimicrobia bacterium]|nr:MFS transporter [Elusimicrobiota bacterium]